MAEYLASIYSTEKDNRKHVKPTILCSNIYQTLSAHDTNCDMTDEQTADNLNQRFYAGRPIYAELSPVTDFREACCRQNENAECTRGGFCNFMHLKEVSRYLKKELFVAQ
ncbi:858_t:CDS:2, partial [Entrophospora sp. SA101]